LPTASLLKKADMGPAYEEVNMTVSNDNARALCEAFFRFAMATGYMPVTILNAFGAMEEEYGFLRRGEIVVSTAPLE
jgi:hypothetical protein